jgi:hypothetical protein
MKIVLALLSAVLLSGCISTQSYIDPALPVVRAEDLQPVAQPRPVQVLYEFRSKGTPNTGVTSHTKAAVMETVTKSRLFSAVSESPVTDGRTLTIVIDNIEVTKDAVSKGFATGLTFGLAGTTVTDGYVCTATYNVPGTPAKRASINHALHTTIGNTTPPAGLTPMKTGEAVMVIIEQVTLNALQALRKDGL